MKLRQRVTNHPVCRPVSMEVAPGELVDRFPGESTVYPGHMGLTTLGRERQTNPFLAELTAR